MGPGMLSPMTESNLPKYDCLPPSGARTCFSYFSALIHIQCTTSAPCSLSRGRIPSKSAYSPPCNIRGHCASLATSTAKSLISGACFSECPVNRGICTDNTTGCALYLTDPIGGGTFATAPLQNIRFGFPVFALFDAAGAGLPRIYIQCRQGHFYPLARFVPRARN
jgi:hypothetical protein